VREHPFPILYPAVSLAIVALVLRVSPAGPAVMGSRLSIAAGFLALACLISIWRPRRQLLLTGLAAHGAAILLVRELATVGGQAGPGYWALVVSAWLTAWAFVQGLAAHQPSEPWSRHLLALAVPFFFGLWILILWEIVVRGFAIPAILLPAPSAIWARLTTSVPTLIADFRQTFLKAVLFGYTVGCLAGFIVAIVADRVPFLRRGLLPIGNLASALPIIGVAPVMVMWFGFDWHSKAAVVIVMTFFPMLVNTIAGLSITETIERDLMRTYAAGYWQTLIKLRLPAALPFIFNALKINSTLALIGAIVAEFFGTPTVGMGFRISTEVGRMGIDMVWAEIAVAALAGSLFYGLLSLIERAATFWHPSFRTQGSR
jgi:NitT/TauT family transport system permease protein